MRKHRFTYRWWALTVLAVLLAACGAPKAPPAASPPAASPPAAPSPAAPPQAAAPASPPAKAPAAPAPPAPKAVDQTAEFFKGKTIRIIVGFGAGGTVDQITRALVPYFQKHMPGNPQFRVENMPGASGGLALNYLYNEAKRDGLTWVAAGARGAMFNQLKGDSAVRHDLSKMVSIGSADSLNLIVYGWKDGPASTWEKALQSSKPIRVGGQQSSAPGNLMTTLVANMIGRKELFTHIVGYPDVPALHLALRRNEVDLTGGAMTTILTNIRDEWNQGKVSVIMQMGTPDRKRESQFANAPTPWEFTKTAKDRQFISIISAGEVAGRPYWLPPEVPADRVEAIRKAFVDAGTDRTFAPIGEKLGLSGTPVPGDKVDELYAEIFSMPKADVQEALKLFGVTN